MEEKRHVEASAKVASTKMNAQNKVNHHAAFQKFCKKYFRKVDDLEYAELNAAAKARQLTIAALTAPFVVAPVSALVYAVRKAFAAQNLRQEQPSILLDELNKYVAEFNAKHNETLSVPETNHIIPRSQVQSIHQYIGTPDYTSMDSAVEAVQKQLMGVIDATLNKVYDAGEGNVITQPSILTDGKWNAATTLLRDLSDMSGDFCTTVTQNYNALAETTGAYANLMLESAIGAGVAYGAIVAPFAVRYLYYRNKLAKSKKALAGLKQCNEFAQLKDHSPQNNQEDLTK